MRRHLSVLGAIALILTTVVLGLPSPSAASNIGDNFDLPWVGTMEISNSYHGGDGLDFIHPDQPTPNFVSPDIMAMGTGTIIKWSCNSSTKVDAGFDLVTDAGVTFTYIHLNPTTIPWSTIEADNMRVSKGDYLGELSPIMFNTYTNQIRVWENGVRIWKAVALFPQYNTTGGNPAVLQAGVETCGTSSSGPHLHLDVPPAHQTMVVDGYDFRTTANGGDVGFGNVWESDAREVQSDNDDDSIPNDEDDCPEEFGSPATNGCPDGDGDTVANHSDICPLLAGTAQHSGCLAPTGDAIGDINGDGYDDVVAEYGYANGWMRLRVFYGSSTGLSSVVTGASLAPSAMWEVERSEINIGNINGDEYDDVVAEYGYDDGRMRIWVWYGGPSGLASSPISEVNLAPGNWEVDRSELVVANINGDKYDDVVAEYGYSDGTVRFRVWYGNDDGLDPVVTELEHAASDWEVDRSDIIVGNINGDEYDDLVIEYTYPDTLTRILIRYGSASGLGSLVTQATFTQSDWDVDRSELTVGNINGDKYDDLIVEYNYTSGLTRIRVWYGALSGLNNLVTQVAYQADDWNTDSSDIVVGNINGDAYDDVVVEYGYGDGRMKVLAFNGSVSGLGALGVEASFAANDWDTWRSEFG